MRVGMGGFFFCQTTRSGFAAFAAFIAFIGVAAFIAFIGLGVVGPLDEALTATAGLAPPRFLIRSNIFWVRRAVPAGAGAAEGD